MSRRSMAGQLVIDEFPRMQGFTAKDPILSTIALCMRMISFVIVSYKP